jgi:transcriptional regulator with XRE-family HTH domain
MPRKPIARQLGAAVRKRRKAERLTQEMLAERAGLSTNYVGNIERGEYDVTVTVLQRVATALGCKASMLLNAAEL